MFLKPSRAWLTGMKPLKNSLPSKASLTFRLKRTPCNENPSRVLGTGPAGHPRKPQVSTPSRCSSRNKPSYSCQDLKSPAQHVLETCQKGPLGLRGRSGIRTSSRCHRTGKVAKTTPFSGVTVLLWRLERLTHPGPNAVRRKEESDILVERSVRHSGTCSLSSGNSSGNSAPHWNFLHHLSPRAVRGGKCKSPLAHRAVTG